MSAMGTLPHRVRYTGKDGEEERFYIMAENAIFAINDFQLRTGKTQECVICVEVFVGHQWIKVV